MNAVIYCRTASTENGQNSIDEQRSLCTSYCQRNGMNVVAEFSDDGFSGNSTDRPGLTAMLQRIEVGGVDSVVLKDAVRLSSDTNAFIRLQDELAKGGIKLCFLAYMNHKENQDDNLYQSTLSWHSLTDSEIKAKTERILSIIKLELERKVTERGE